jgi:hypothetical protein
MVAMYMPTYICGRLCAVKLIITLSVYLHANIYHAKIPLPINITPMFTMGLGRSGQKSKRELQVKEPPAVKVTLAYDSFELTAP